jgi:inhibitor of KinA
VLRRTIFIYLSGMPMPLPQITAVSESAWLIQWHSRFDLTVNSRIHLLSHWLKKILGNDVQQIVPAYDSLLVEFPITHILTAGYEHLHQKLTALVLEGWQQIMHGAEVQKQPPVSIPVCYDPSLGNDLEAMVAFSQLEWAEVVNLHAANIYQVFFIGFQPGFAYMGSVHEAIAVPRKKEPVQVKAGAVGIAGHQTGIYPFNSPGGWHIVGYTPLKMFDAGRQPPVLLTPGAEVQFEPISIDSYHQWHSL